ncbi:Phosphorelay intermediate protein [Lithohypha guttulata]|uniref:Phosphorelay intermediate protein n=1 Tax=Lithohypha guttulata TaxID=1690604 RepID=UPI002DE05077|nr:Phosphorelay intermediate protein [Lithohypha guttulata]
MAEEAEFDFGDNVDTSTFEQILDMDEGEEEGGHEFSKSIVFGFLDQAETTFVKMDAAKKKGDLPELSSLGHFLKGSSATLGFTKVKEECEKIQHYGQNKDESGVHDEDDDEKCLKLIGQSIEKAQVAYRTIKKLMEDYYAKLEEGG